MLSVPARVEQTAALGGAFGAGAAFDDYFGVDHGPPVDLDVLWLVVTRVGIDIVRLQVLPVD